MKRYNIYRVEGGKFDQCYSYRLGITGKHSIEVATGEIMTDSGKKITDDKSKKSYIIFEDSYGRQFAAHPLS